MQKETMTLIQGIMLYCWFLYTKGSMKNELLVGVASEGIQLSEKKGFVWKELCLFTLYSLLRRLHEEWVVGECSFKRHAARKGILITGSVHVHCSFSTYKDSMKDKQSVNAALIVMRKEKVFYYLYVSIPQPSLVFKWNIFFPYGCFPCLLNFFILGGGGF